MHTCHQRLEICCHSVDCILTVQDLVHAFSLAQPLQTPLQIIFNRNPPTTPTEPSLFQQRLTIQPAQVTINQTQLQTTNHPNQTLTLSAASHSPASADCGRPHQASCTLRAHRGLHSDTVEVGLWFRLGRSAYVDVRPRRACCAAGPLAHRRQAHQGLRSASQILLCVWISCAGLETPDITNRHMALIHQPVRPDTGQHMIGLTCDTFQHNRSMGGI